MIGNRPPAVVIAVRDFRITVVAAFLDQVEFVAAFRTHLVFPQAALPIERDAQWVAVAQRPDLRRHAALVGERVVGRYAPVLVQANDFAEVGVHVLCRGELLALARGDPELPVRAERKTMPVMAFA